jgi:hypothetical protein
VVVLVAGVTTAWANGKAGATHVYDEPHASVYEWVLLCVLFAGVIAVMVAKIIFDRKRRLPGAAGRKYRPRTKRKRGPLTLR